MRCLGWVSLLLMVSSSAHAGTWGESWGSMVWGAVVAVPSLGWVGGALLVGLLVGLAWWRKPGRAGAALGLLLALGFAPVAEAQTVSVPNTLNNSSVADAPAMNANFDAVLNGANAALTSGPVSLPNTFTNGTTANADEVNANFTAVVDGVNTALSNRATDCAGAGGTWNAGTSTCTPALSYDCFRAGLCGSGGYNAGLFVGDTRSSTGCDSSSSQSAQYDLGFSFFINIPLDLLLYVGPDACGAL